MLVTMRSYNVLFLTREKIILRISIVTEITQIRTGLFLNIFNLFTAK